MNTETEQRKTRPSPQKPVTAETDSEMVRRIVARAGTVAQPSEGVTMLVIDPSRL